MKKTVLTALAPIIYFTLISAARCETLPPADPRPKVIAIQMRVSADPVVMPPADKASRQEADTDS